MATLVFSVAGAAIGSTFGMTSLGWTIGSFIGNQLFPQKTELPPVFGPRLGDLKVQTSTYGNMIPLIFGTMRVAGNVIWSTDIQERATTNVVSSGGKGGGGSTSQTQTTYSYSVSCAVGCCEGPIKGIRRIWASGKLIRNLADDASVETMLASDDSVTIYLGDEEQMPDPTIEEEEGVGNVQAFRGTAYVVFKDFQLADYGNRMPNFEFEVVRDGAEALVLSARTITGLGIDSSKSVIGGGTIVWVQETRPTSFDPINVAAFDIATGGRMLLRNNLPAEPKWADESGRLWLITTGGALYSLTLDGLLTAYTKASGPVFSDMTYANKWISKDNVLYYGWDQGAAGFIGSITLDHVAKTFVHRLYNASHVSVPLTNGASVAGRLYCTSNSNSTAAIWGYYDLASGAWTTLFNYGSNGIMGAGIVGTDGYVYIGKPSPRQYIRKYDANTGVEIDSVAVPSVTTSGVSNAFIAFVEDNKGMIWSHVMIDPSGGSSAGVVQFDPADMTLKENTGVIPPADPSFPGRFMTGGLFEGSNPVLVRYVDTSTFKLQFPSARLSTNQVDLADVVTEICQLTELGRNDINVSSLVGTYINGYAVGQRGTVRGMIEPLMQAYFFDAVESDRRIKFVKRGTAALVNIPEDKMAASEGEGDPDEEAIMRTRAQELELPIEVNIAYLSLSDNYQPSQQLSRRITTPTKNVLTIQLPMALTDDEARNIAHAYHYTLWLERNSVKFKTGREFTKYEPTDSVTIPAANTIQKVRLTNKHENPVGVIEWSAVFEDGTQYTQSVPGAVGVVVDNEIGLVGPTYVHMLDVPMLRHVDDDPGFYIAMYGLGSSWIGGQLYRSADNVTYEPVTNGLVLLPSTVGYTNGVLGLFGGTDNTEVFDEINSLSVTMNTGELVSLTEGEVLAGGNVILIGNEFIQYVTATLTAPKTYTLRRLLRGRLGTEQYINTHVSGERVVLIDDTLRTIPQTFADLNVSYYYKAVSIGKTLPQTAPFVFTNTGVRKKPLAPWHLGSGRNAAGDFTMQWNRRTRYPNPTWNLAVDPPLQETAEEYTVDILNALGATVRSITVNDVLSATYTAAQQVTDFGSTQASIRWRVCQVSPEYGKGFTASRIS